jgi:hypothetical protein
MQRLLALLARSNQENAACAKDERSVPRPVQPSGVFLGVKFEKGAVPLLSKAHKTFGATKNRYK